jgi:hypothetical protein
VIDCGLLGQTARAFKPVGQNRVLQTDVNYLIEVGQDGVEFSRQIESVGQIKTNAARDNSTPQQAIASQ